MPPSSRPSSRTSRPPSRPPSQPQPQESLYDRLHTGLEIAEHWADEAGVIAGQAGKAARVGDRILSDVEDAYGQAGGSGGRYSGGGYGEGKGGSAGGYESTGSEGSMDQPPPKAASKAQSAPSVQPPESKPVPYKSDRQVRQRASGTLAPPGSAKDAIASLEADISYTQEAVDKVFDSIEEIAGQRHRLTGGPYPRIRKTVLSKVQPGPLPRSHDVEGHESSDLIDNVNAVKPRLLAQYKAVCAIQPRFNALKSSATARADPTFGPLSRHSSTLNKSFAGLLDFVEERAEEEKKDVTGGQADQRLLARMKEEHPEWRKNKRLTELKKAKEQAKAQGWGKVDVLSYACWWMLDQPFAEFESVIQTIDLSENRISSPADEKTGTWALGSLLHKASMAFPHAHASGKSRPKSSSSSKSLTEREVGKRSSRRTSSSKSYYSEGKDQLKDVGSDVSTDTDDWSDSEKKLLGGGGAGKGGIDLSQLPERVPTDDTSGYQETPEELLEDAKDQQKTERIYTPLLLLWWSLIACLYIYWALARFMGYENPLGNVDLGGHLGNTRWNDTSDGLTRSDGGPPGSTSSTSSEPYGFSSASGPTRTDGVPPESTSSTSSEPYSSSSASEMVMDDLQASLTSLQGVLASLSAAGVLDGVDSMPKRTAMPVVTARR
ncbi:hypothetical protein JCM11641_004823 [Rhodosporidiobolus odoratus]